MHWDLKASGVRLPEGLAVRLGERLGFALERFAPRIERVVVFLHDLNGPRGGIDKACRIVVKIRGCGMVTAGVVDPDWWVAVDRATTRIGHTVSRTIERRRSAWHLRINRRSAPDPLLGA
ncbi:MAG: HPF/RaiA family ribosome-associated protein [Planctomycetia bacterium]|nr:HPF/RaiA family ribosome-associated protein [Planctomycetia bacterium]